MDYSRTPANRPTYDDRTGKIEFYLENDYAGWDWETAYTTICETLKGQRVRFALEDNPSHYYSGLLWVNQLKSDKGHSKITLEYNLHPTMYTLKVEAVALNVYDLKLNRGMEYQLLVGVGPTNTFYRKMNVTAGRGENYSKWNHSGPAEGHSGGDGRVRRRESRVRRDGRHLRELYH